MYIVLLFLFALYVREAAWEHFWKKQLFKTALAWVLSKGHSSSGKGCFSVGPTVEPQVLPGACCSMIFITMIVHRLQGYSLFQHGLLPSLQGNLLWYLMHLLLLPWSKSLQACFSHIFLTPLSHSSYAALFSFLKRIIKALLMGSAFASRGSILGLNATGSVHHGDRFWCPITEIIPVAFLLLKPCHLHQIKTAQGCISNIQNLNMIKVVLKKVWLFTLLTERFWTLKLVRAAKISGICRSFECGRE